MSGSESKSERETNGSSPSDTDRTSLVDFLAPPRPRSSFPAPRPEAASSNETAATTNAPEPETAQAIEPIEPVEPVEKAAEAETPTAPTASTEPPPAAAFEKRAAEATTVSASSESRRSQAPSSSTDLAARSLIPVATSTTPSDAGDADIDEEFGVPGAGPPWSSASIRRMTYVALLAAAAAVPAWVVFRARSVDVQARNENVAPKAAAAGPSTLQPAREIEADDEEDIAEPAPPQVAVDPAKALEARREARRLLEAGNIEPGVAAARNAIALNPADPEAYVLLAAGLQDMGRWAESREVFSRCVHKSKDGINAECAYFATSGTITNR
jgi:nicotinate-nucleotide--dimethylbenzimidazole phosphoribosyltransferase